MGVSTTRLMRSEMEYAIDTLNNMEKNNTLHFDLPIQRQEIWKDEKKSLWIHTLLYGYPYDNMVAEIRNDNELWILDGKQRLTTVIDFINEGFSLESTTPPVPVNKDVADKIEVESKKRDIVWNITQDEDDNNVYLVDVAGLPFCQLPDVFQNVIRNEKLKIIEIRGLNEDERDIMFQRLNGGEPLKPIELNRVYAGSKVMEFIRNNVSNQNFFSNVINVAKSSRKRLVDEEIILQTMHLVEYNFDHKVPKGTSTGTSTIRQYAMSKKKKGITEEIQKIMIETTDYLNKAFIATEDFLKKGNVPMIFLLAWKKAIPEGKTPEEFGGFIQQFFAPFERNSKLSMDEFQSEYRRGASGSTTKADNVNKRIQALFNGYIENIDNAPTYKIPEPKIASAGRRGRPRKNPIEVAALESDQQQEIKNETEYHKNLQRQNDPMFDEKDEANKKQEEENDPSYIGSH